MFEEINQLPKWFMAIGFFIYGSFFGSFANVLIFRLQQDPPLSLFKKSYCPHCKYSIPFYLNIPILSWFLLKGTCVNCSKSFSFRYPFVEFLMSCLFCALFLAIGWKWFLLESLIFTVALVSASFIDWDQMIIPDSLSLSGIIIGLLGAFLNPDRSFLDSFLGVILGGGGLLLVAYIYYLLRKKEGMGGGDIKMMAWIGAVLGWQSLLFVLLSSSILGTLFGLITMLQGNKKVMQTAFPFGPYLALSALIYIFLIEFNFNFLSIFRVNFYYF
ncbi:MAG: prepilin peptidase [Bdellovibrionaceae bacterium]|nr:prepilin peptidase [Pseudobdellovibrionaceae bacterium]